MTARGIARCAGDARSFDRVDHVGDAGASADLHDTLRAAAFGSAPARDMPQLDDSSGRTCWLAGVVTGAHGRYAAAVALLEPVMRGPDAVVSALAASTLAAHLRQLGGHASARRLDGRALARVGSIPDVWTASEPDPDGADRFGAWCDALLGVAADALGDGELAVTRRLLARVASVLGKPGAAAGGSTLCPRIPDMSGSAVPESGWRARVRLDWVTAETELAAGHPAEAMGPARRAQNLAFRVGALRHRIKSGMILGAALIGVGNRDEARELLHETGELAAAHGQLPLVWPVAGMLAELEPARTALHDRTREAALGEILAGATGPMRQLARTSPWFPAAGDQRPPFQ